MPLFRPLTVTPSLLRPHAPTTRFLRPGGYRRVRQGARLTQPELVTAPTLSDSTPVVGDTVSVTTGTWDAGDQTGDLTFTYAWLRDGTPISGATTNSYTLVPADAGAVVTARVTARNGSLTTSAAVSTTGIASVPDGSAAAVVITGTPAVGETLTVDADAPSWQGTPAPSLTYTWYRVTAGPTRTPVHTDTAPGGLTYTLVPGDYDATIEVDVTGTNPAGSDTQTSAAVGPVAGVAPVFAGAPTIALQAPDEGVPGASAGDAGASDTLVVTSTNLSGVAVPAASLSYDWRRDGVSIGLPDAPDQDTYTFVDDDYGADVTVVITATNTAGTDVSPASNAIGPVLGEAPTINVAPAVTGSTNVGNILTCSSGTWNGVPQSFTYTYQWQDLGDVTYTPPTFQQSPAGRFTIGAGTITYNDDSEDAVLISNEALPGDGYFDFSVGSPVTYMYVGLVPESNIASLLADPGENNLRQYGFNLFNETWAPEGYAIAENGSQVGPIRSYASVDALRIRRSGSAVTYLTVTGGTETLVYTSTLPASGAYRVGIIAITNTGSPTTFDNPTLQASDVFGDIPGATGPTYTIQPGDASNDLRCVVTADNGVTPNGAAPSNAVSVTGVAPVFDNPPTIAVQADIGQPGPSVGDVNANDTLEVTATGLNGAATPTPTLTYRWIRQDSPPVDVGSNQDSYQVQPADHGFDIVCEITASNTVGSDTSTSNALTVNGEQPANTALPVISGTTAVGQVLSTTDGTWTGFPALTPADFTYQWQREQTTHPTWTALGSQNDFTTGPDGAITRTGSAGWSIGNATAGQFFPNVGDTVTLDFAGDDIMYVGFTPAPSIVPVTASDILGQDGFLIERNSSGQVRIRDLPGGTAINSWVSVPIGSPVTVERRATDYLVSYDGTSYPVAGASGDLYASAYMFRAGVGLGRFERVGFVDIDDTPPGTSTGDTYTLQDTDYNTGIRVIVTADNGEVAPVDATAASVGPIAGTVPVIDTDPVIQVQAPDQGLAGPSIGDAHPDDVIELATAAATDGTEAPAANITYEWFRDGTTSVGTGTTYTVQPGDLGSTITVVATATNAIGSDTSLASGGLVVNGEEPANTALPVISGPGTAVGQTLSTTDGTWTGFPALTPADFTYQWQRDTGSGFGNIPGATANTYTLQPADANADIRVIVTADNGEGSPVDAASAATVLWVDALGLTWDYAWDFTDAYLAGGDIAALSGEIDLDYDATGSNASYILAASSGTVNPPAYGLAQFEVSRQATYTSVSRVYHEAQLPLGDRDLHIRAIMRPQPAPINNKGVFVIDLDPTTDRQIAAATPVGGGITFLAETLEGNTTFSSAPLAPGDWFLADLVIRGDELPRLYVNGSLISRAHGPSTPARAFAPGALPILRVGGAFGWNGFQGDVVFFGIRFGDITLSEHQDAVDAVFSGVAPVVGTSPVISVQAPDQGQAGPSVGDANANDTVEVTTAAAADGNEVPTPPTITYRWQRDTGSGFSDIVPAATGTTYQVDPADYNNDIRVVATISNAAGSVDEPSNALTVNGEVPANTALPTLAVSNVYNVGQTIEIDDDGTWTGYPDPTV